jgi:hypothetical protein
VTMVVLELYVTMVCGRVVCDNGEGCGWEKNVCDNGAC